MNVNKLIEKGEDAFKKRNYDYAISIFLEAVHFAPDNRQAREGLRNAALKKHEKNYPGKLAVAIFGIPARLGMFVAGLGKKGNPEGYMMACEKFLRIDPKNRRVNTSLGDVYRLGPPTYYEEWLPTVPVSAGADGSLTLADGSRPAAEYVLTTCRTAAGGTVVARSLSGSLVLSRIDGPLRLASGPTCRKDVPWEP